MKIQNLKKGISSLAVAVAALSATAPAVAGPEEYLGEIMLVGFNFCPRGSTPAEGQLLQISQNTALFSLYGTTYGGDGRTTFGLPDLRGRVPISQGQGPGLPNYNWGQKSGVTSVTLNTQTLPAHNHSANVTVTSTLRGAAGNANTGEPSGNNLAKADTNTYLINRVADVDLASDSITNQTRVTIGNTGSSRSFSVQSPYLAMRYCVVSQGTFPSRN